MALFNETLNLSGPGGSASQRVNRSASEVKNRLRRHVPGQGEEIWHVTQEQCAAFAVAKA